MGNYDTIIDNNSRLNTLAAVADSLPGGGANRGTELVCC